MKRRGLLGLATTGFLLAGCAASPSPTSVSPDVVAATPVAAQVETPQPLLAGECPSLLDDAEASLVIGEPVALAPLPNSLTITYSAIPQLGGIECVWETTNAGGPVLGVIVAPNAALDTAAAASSCVDEGYCAITDISSGFRLYAFVYSASGDASTKVAGLEMVRSAFRAAVAQLTPATSYAPEGAWTSSIDCAALDESRAFGSALGDPSVVGETIELNNPDPNQGVADVLSAAPTVACSWTSPTEDTAIVIETLGGGAWVEETLAAAPGSTRVDVPGVDGAVLTGSRLDVFVGVNRLTIEVRSSVDGPSIQSLYGPVAAVARQLATG